MTNCQLLWNKIVENIKQLSDSAGFQSSFAEVEHVALEGNNFIIKVSSPFVSEWLKQNYRQVILDQLSQELDQPINLVFQTDSDAVLEDSYADVKKTVKNIPVLKKKKLQFNLKDDFTFDNFIIGGTNQMAHAASYATAQNPGCVYNPLFIYGGVGLGKTHLMQAIGHLAHQKDDDLNVIYVSCEKLLNEFIESLKNKNTAAFRAYYRNNVDVLLIDDIQFLSNKNQLQEEFFNTFNSFLQNGKQIVMTSDKLPQELQHIEDRLVNRFESGLVVDIQSPDFETRVAIIQKKLEKYGLFFEEEVNYYLANMVRSNVRQIEGALTKLIAYSSIQNTPVTLKFAQECLKGYVIAQDVTLDSIQKAVADFYNIGVDDMKSHRRPRKIAQPRQFAMFLCRNLTNNSLTEIAQSFGGKDHTTVMYACRKVKQLIDDDHQVKQQLKKLENSLLNS